MARLLQCGFAGGVGSILGTPVEFAGVWTAAGGAPGPVYSGSIGTTTQNTSPTEGVAYATFNAAPVDLDSFTVQFTSQMRLVPLGRIEIGLLHPTQGEIPLLRFGTEWDEYYGWEGIFFEARVGDILLADQLSWESIPDEPTELIATFYRSTPVEGEVVYPERWYVSSPYGHINTSPYDGRPFVLEPQLTGVTGAYIRITNEFGAVVKPKLTDLIIDMDDPVLSPVFWTNFVQSYEVP